MRLVGNMSLSHHIRVEAEEAGAGIGNVSLGLFLASYTCNDTHRMGEDERLRVYGNNNA